MSPRTFVCSQCGCQRAIPGRLRAAGGVCFAPEHTEKFFSIDGTVAVHALACLDCGAVQATVDPEKLRSLTGDAKTTKTLAMSISPWVLNQLVPLTVHNPLGAAMSRSRSEATQNVTKQRNSGESSAPRRIQFSS